jgi:outer membrane lipoprotein-sorting protein
MKNLPIVILLLVAFSLGCSGLMNRFTSSSTNSGSSNTTSTSPSSTSSSGTESAPPTGDPRDAIIQASKKFMDLPQFTAKMDGEGGNEMHMKLEYVAPNRFHMYLMENNGEVRTETVMIDKDMYVKFGGHWQKIPGAVANNKVPNLRDYFNQEGIKNLKQVNYLGEDTVDGLPAHVYSYHSDVTATNSMTPYPYDTKIWIDTNEGLPRKIEVTYQGGNLKTATITYDYSSSISVEPPI